MVQCSGMGEVIQEPSKESVERNDLEVGVSLSSDPEPSTVVSKQVLAEWHELINRRRRIQVLGDVFYMEIIPRITSVTEGSSGLAGWLDVRQHACANQSVVLREQDAIHVINAVLFGCCFNL